MFFANHSQSHNWHVTALCFFPGVLGGAHDWCSYRCPAVRLPAVPPCARYVREARHTEGHTVPRGPARDQGGVHWAQDTGPISLEMKIVSLTHPLCTPRSWSILSPHSFCTHTSPSSFSTQDRAQTPLFSWFCICIWTTVKGLPQP